LAGILSVKFVSARSGLWGEGGSDDVRPTMPQSSIRT
jgi:hypothetical protein